MSWYSAYSAYLYETKRKEFGLTNCSIISQATPTGLALSSFWSTTSTPSRDGCQVWNLSRLFWDLNDDFYLYIESKWSCMRIWDWKFYHFPNIISSRFTNKILIDFIPRFGLLLTACWRWMKVRKFKNTTTSYKWWPTIMLNNMKNTIIGIVHLKPKSINLISM